MPQNSSESGIRQNYLERNPIYENRQRLLACPVLVFEKNIYVIENTQQRYLCHWKTIYRSVIIEVLRSLRIKMLEFFLAAVLCASRKTHRQTVSASAVSLLRQKRKKRTLAETPQRYFPPLFWRESKAWHIHGTTGTPRR